MNVTVAGGGIEQVIILDTAIISLRRPMDTRRAMATQFGLLGGIAAAIQDKKADKEAARLRPRSLESMRGVVECKVAELPVEFTSTPGWPKVGAGMAATVYPKTEFRSLQVSFWRGIRFALRTSPRQLHISVPFWHVGRVRQALSDRGYPLEA